MSDETLSDKLLKAHSYMVLVERCDEAIAEYARAGFEGTVHDVENRQIREDALLRMTKMCRVVLAAGETPEQRLAKIKAFVTDPARLQDWDAWRRYIAMGGKASWPRDSFESVLDWIGEECGP